VRVELIPLEGLPEVGPGDDLAAMLVPPLRELGLRAGDVVAVTQKVVSKAEGRLASAADRDTVVAAETVRVVARRGELLIAETRHGLVCANAGVDASNLEEGVLSLLPEDPDASAARLREALTTALGVEAAVVITDTFGRPWREGVVNVAIGCAGLPALLDLRGSPDHHGRAMETTVVALADEVAAASGLVMTKSARVPVAIVRGVDRAGAPNSAARDVVRAPAEDLFRESPLQSVHSLAHAHGFGPGEVPRSAVEEAVRAATGSGRADGWLFVAVDSAAGRQRVRSALDMDRTAAAAPLLLVPCAPPDGSDPLAAGRTLQDLLLALHAQGVASAWTRATPMQGRAILDALELAGDAIPFGVVAAGPMPEGGTSPPHPPDPAGLLRWR
jgi:dehydro coenzyme F420 reductase / coenzyme F420-0:L-glutamate ligase / coenzyme F420-1:gamma-L-glutamate ligase